MGNLFRDIHGRQFVFNGDNKQVEVRNSANQIVGEYKCDGNGKRTKKITANEYVVFRYDGLGNLIREYSTAVEPAAIAKTSYLTTDHLGSPRVLTDQLGQVISRRDFHPFGEEIATPQRTQSVGYIDDSVRQKFTGYERDEETGLDFAPARYYNPVHGRFTAVDPLLASGKSADPQTFNRYAYAMNRPLILTDPNGLQAGRPVRPQSGTVETVRVQVKAQSAPRIETYPVKGQNSSEVWKSAGESRETGFPGAFNGPLSWSATFTPTSTRRTRGGYSVTVQTSEIEIEIKDPKITLPEWENKSDASPEEQEKWETSLEKLKKHEFDHHDIAVDSLNNIMKPALEAIPAPIVGQGTGKTPEEARNAAIKNATEKIQTEFKKADQKAKDKQNQFDECTDHGRQSCQQ